MATTTFPQTRQIPQAAVLTRVGIGVGLGVLSGALLTLAFQPYSFWPLAFFAYVPMLVASHRIVPRKWAGVPVALGYGSWLVVLLVRIFGFNAHIWFFPAIGVLIALINLMSEPGVRLFHERTGYRWFVLGGAFMVAGIEMLRSFIPPINTHFFMVQTAYTQPWLLQPISIFNIYGLSLVIMLVNYALANAIMGWIDHRQVSAPGNFSHWFEAPAFDLRRSLRWLGGVGALLVAWCAVGVIMLATAPKNPPTVRVAAIQNGFMTPGHQDPASQAARLQALAEQTRIAAAQGAQLMVWPELGIGFDPQVEHTAELKTLAAETGAYLLIGYGVTDDPRGWRNEAVMLTPAGEFLPVYGKNHASNPGEDPIVTAGVYPVYDTPLGRIATIICNDVNYTDTTRKLAANGAQLVTIPTWEVAMPGFHWEMPIQGVLRGVENRVATVKADTAHSALIADPYGRILARRDGAPGGEAFALVADVPLGSGNTLSQKMGDWMGWVCLAGAVIFMVFQNVQDRKSKKSK